METAKIKELVSRMTLEEKASLCSGLDFWHTKGVERLGIPSEMVSDGPHGLRKQDDKADHLGINDSIQAVCFPAGCATASSFNRELVTKLGETLGEGPACVNGNGRGACPRRPEQTYRNKSEAFYGK